LQTSASSQDDVAVGQPQEQCDPSIKTTKTTTTMTAVATVEKDIVEMDRVARRPFKKIKSAAHFKKMKGASPDLKIILHYTADGHDGDENGIIGVVDPCRA
jgi:hypothetical protein